MHRAEHAIKNIQNTQGTTKELILDEAKESVTHSDTARRTTSYISHEHLQFNSNVAAGVKRGQRRFHLPSPSVLLSSCVTFLRASCVFMVLLVS